MMLKKQTKENEQIAKIIERDQIISYKKKPSSNKPQKESDDQIQSANSLKSGVFSQDSEVRTNKKNTPLPQLYRDKKRIFHKNFVIGQVKQVNNYLEKQVRQHDNLVLKQKNNLLTTENMKLKTRVMTLEKQIMKITKNIDEDSQKPKQPGLLPKDNKFKGSEALSLKMAIKNLRRQLDQQKKQNQKIKWSVKFTRINQLQCQRDQIMNQTVRLRQLLQQQQMKRVTLKSKQQGSTNLQQKVQSLTDKNLALVRQNAQLNKKIKNFEQGNKKLKQVSQNQKNLSKMLFNAKRLIKQKEKQIQNLKVQNSATQPKIQSIASINMDPKSTKQVSRVTETSKSKQKRIMSKSAQKYRKKVSEEAASSAECENCFKHKQRIALLEKKIQQLTMKLKAQKQNNSKFGNMGEFSRQEIQLPKTEDVQKLARFLVFRFKAHHLSLDEAQKYLINGELTQTTKKQSLTVLEMAQSLVAEPFSVLSSKYLQICLLKLFYPQQCQKGQKQNKIKINQTKKLTKGEILANFTKFVRPYQIMGQQKQQEMFIQIAQLVTNYHQHILTALNRKKNGEGTISEQQLINFFNQIQLEKEFVDFIICQIILESLDLEHLNYYTMFEIFYMPAQNQPAQVEPNQPNKKKFQVQHSQVVKQQDQQYEESKSHIDTAGNRQRTQSRKQQQQQQQYQYEDQQHQHSPSQHSQKQKVNQDESSDNIKTQARQKRNKSLKNVQAKLQKEKQREKQKEKEKEKKQKTKQKEEQNENQDDYEQLFEQQKMDQLPQQQKAHQNKQGQQQLKPYVMEEVYDEYKEDQN